MELPRLGQNCAEPSCNQLDFLPLNCKCGTLFCSDHFSKHALDCPAVQVENEPNVEPSKPNYVCSNPGCKSASYLPLICEKCLQHFCVRHRHVTECFKKDPQTLAAEVEKLNAPAAKFNEAKMEVDKQVCQWN